MPTIVVGNLNTGGTGKTPHTIALANLLFDLNPAILSRGYGRKTKGFLKLDQESTALQVGDEPLLYKKHTAARVAVCENRVAGIEKLAEEPRNQCVLLDDAFQHRKLKGDYNILIIAKANPIWTDYYLPTGDLRDHKNQIKRADAVILSGCGSEADLIDARTHLNLRSDQKSYWSATQQLPLRNWKTQENLREHKSLEIVLVTAIAKANRLKDYLDQRYSVIKHFGYRDHHYYSEKEVDQWVSFLDSHPNAVLVTTEKDAIRMTNISGLAEHALYVAPIEIKIAGADELVNDLKTRISSSH